MDFNTLLTRLGIDSSNFINKENEPIKIDNGFIYDVEQIKTNKECPYCHSNHSEIKGYYFTETNCSETDNITDILRIKKVRFKCKNCGKTFTPEIRGIEKYATISKQVEQFIYNDFFKPLTLSEIASRYGLTRQRIIQIFDDRIRYVPKLKIPSVLCIDEIHFCEEFNQKYCCVLYDFERREIVDIIRNRQIPYLNEYFNEIPVKERNNVKIFISDMYDGYKTICHHFFPNAIHIVDMFHIIIQLTRAVNQIRVNTMKHKVTIGSVCYNFMKTNWKLFLCREETVPDKTYTYRRTGEVFHFDELISKCIKLDPALLEAYTTLQDMFHFSYYSSHKEALTFIEHISKRLINSNSNILKKVGETYYRWRVEIANAYSTRYKGKRYTNAIAESLNNHLKTIIKSAYGYHNFERFRKRVLLMLTYSKKS